MPECLIPDYFLTDFQRFSMRVKRNFEPPAKSYQTIRITNKKELSKAFAVVSNSRKLRQSCGNLFSDRGFVYRFCSALEGIS
jgi:hypothetical protein